MFRAALSRTELRDAVLLGRAEVSATPESSLVQPAHVLWNRRPESLQRFLGLGEGEGLPWLPSDLAPRADQELPLASPRDDVVHRRVDDGRLGQGHYVWLLAEDEAGFSAGTSFVLKENAAVLGNRAFQYLAECVVGVRVDDVGSFVSGRRAKRGAVPVLVCVVRGTSQLILWRWRLVVTPGLGIRSRKTCGHLAEQHEHGGHCHPCGSVLPPSPRTSSVTFPSKVLAQCNGVTQNFAPEGHDSVTWVENTLAVKKFSEADRTVYELRVIAEVFRLAGCYDQLNLGALACMEALMHRWQLTWEAHIRDPQVPCCEAACYFGIGGRRSTGVAAALAQHVARSMGEEAGIEKQRSKVRARRRNHDHDCARGGYLCAVCSDQDLLSLGNQSGSENSGQGSVNFCRSPLTENVRRSEPSRDDRQLIERY